MSDGPYRTPNADEFSEKLKAADRPTWAGTLLKLLIVAVIVVVAIALLLPNVRFAGEAARRSHCSNNMKQIAIALHNYSEEHGSLPPSYTVDADGNRLHSWRTLLLPYVGQRHLYDSIDLTKPWDDPVNAPASKTRVSSYHCASNAIPSDLTIYLAVVTPNSCISPEPRKASEITDAKGETVMVIEVGPEQAVPWMSPMDADEDLVLSLGDSSKLPHPGGMQVAMADASVRFLDGNLPAAQRRALISIAGGDEIETGGAD